jgi:hypothetical protein
VGQGEAEIEVADAEEAVAAIRAGQTRVVENVVRAMVDQEEPSLYHDPETKKSEPVPVQLKNFPESS